MERYPAPDGGASEHRPAAEKAEARTLQRRDALTWVLILAFWLDWALTSVALESSPNTQELNPFGVALYQRYGPLGLAALKVLSSLVVLSVSRRVRPRLVIKVMLGILGLYVFIIVWNIIQMAHAF